MELSRAQCQLIEDNVNLAQAIAHRVWSSTTGYDRDELISCGYLGLTSAAQRWPDYCAEHNYEAYGELSPSWFKTYASRRIKGQIVDAMRASDPATRRERSLVKQIKSNGVDLSLAWDYVSAETIGHQANMDPGDVKKAVAALVRMPSSLSDLHESAHASDASAEDSVLRAQLCALLVEVVRSASRWKREVICMSLYAGMSDAEILAEMSELRVDPEMGPHALAWIEHWRADARELLIRMVRAYLVEAEPGLAAARTRSGEVVPALAG